MVRVRWGQVGESGVGGGEVADVVRGMVVVVRFYPFKCH